jgi:hypothetical protein
MTLAGFLAYSLALAIAAAIPGPGVTALVLARLAPASVPRWQCRSDWSSAI